MSQMILYDLPSKDPRVCWSYNPWKTRLVLNFKKLNYKTIWTEYPDIEPTFRGHLPPLQGERAYTIPTMQFPDGTFVMDSQNIAERIEKDHPKPPLHLDSPFLEKVNEFGPKIMAIIRPMVIAGVYANLLPEKSRGYFEKHGRVRQLPEEKEQEELWIQASPGIKELGELLRANGGPFLMGNTPSYADFIVVAWLQFVKTIDEKNLYQRWVSIDPAVGKLYEASKPWLERNDH